MRARARHAPILLVLEDCHWLDSLSVDMLEAIVRGTVDLPVLVILSYQAAQIGEHSMDRFERFPQCTAIELASLTASETERLIALKLTELWQEREAPSGSAGQRVAALAQGNPFYVEELLNYVHEQGLDPGDDESLSASTCPPA